MEFAYLDQPFCFPPASLPVHLSVCLPIHLSVSLIWVMHCSNFIIYPTMYYNSNNQTFDFADEFGLFVCLYAGA